MGHVSAKKTKMDHRSGAHSDLRFVNNAIDVGIEPVNAASKRVLSGVKEKSTSDVGAHRSVMFRMFSNKFKFPLRRYVFV